MECFYISICRKFEKPWSKALLICTEWRPAGQIPSLIRITWASLDSHQKPELPVEKSWFGTINNSAHSWPADDRKTWVECPLLPNGNYYLVISKKVWVFFFFGDWIVSRLKEARRISGSGSGKTTSALKRACFASCAEKFSLSPSRHCAVVWSGCWTAMKRSCHMTCNRVSYFIMVASLEMISYWHRNGNEARIWSRHADCVRIKWRWPIERKNE